MKFHIPPANQGQIVEVSYGWLEGALLRKSFDASDRTETIRYLADPWVETEEGSPEAAELESWDPWNDCPPAWLDAALDNAPEITRERLDRMEAA